ncbi:MAG: hypothetical protein ACREA4_12805, partial [Nitrososphaera sp.]
TTTEQELHNIEKCFAAGLQEPILLCPEKKRLDKLRAFIVSELIEEKQAKVKFFLPDDFLSYLEEREGQQRKEEKTVRGYKVKVKYQALDEEQQQARKQAIADVIVKSMKRMTEEK